MSRQISMDAALAVYQRKVGELINANILLEASNADLEAENAALRQRLAETQTDGAAPPEGH